ncbi:anthranilate phosphoribosyltransferase [Pseudohongiella acticola]|uniref:Anthranilate phosphoribosyltransferase n=1 Tax=Pseudohongiella acticola TaxID=1524254 RepID=A0A1E8CMJ8_9GAMM|nr:anthranilate phosphoribosyltransferase [Pseudohongiella acticola]OFE13623.1 anthranilate phosphoribosyltransferase [Pseudohongiella acticola]
MDIKQSIRRLTDRQDFTADQMTDLMRELMTGKCTDAQVAAVLIALQMKGIRTPELLGAVRVMRELATPVAVPPDAHLVDTCGTGGTGTDTFNISTSAAMVAACAGARVAKHGNRGATSKSGSADLLETAGVNLAISPEQVAACIEELGVGFMFAPGHHSAMKHVIGARREIGVRTIFNMLGPLTNPASAPNQVLGVFDPVWIEPILDVLKELGSRHVLVLASDDGLDEISISAPTQIGELRDGHIVRFTVTPADFGMTQREGFAMLQVHSPQESYALVQKALCYEDEAAGDIVALNAGAAIYAANLVDDLPAGVARAQAILRSGEALQKLQALARFSSAMSTG